MYAKGVTMKQVYDIVPASGSSIWILFAATLFLALFIAFFGWIVYSSRNAKFEVSASGLRIRADMYGREVPRHDLLPDQARIISIDKEERYRPVLRTNGVGLPGYKSGWFELKNGEKALAFITSTKDLVYIPTNKGYCILLSVSKPSEFLESLGTVKR